MARRSDGTLIAVFYRGGGAGELTVSADVYKAVSTDSVGSSWGSPALAVSETDACRDPKITRLANGNLILSYTLSDDSTYWRPKVRISTDDGATWGSAIAITNGFTNPDQVFISAPIVQLANGDLLAPMYGDWGSPAVNSVSRVSKSTDGGSTWSALAVVASGGGRDWTEPNICLLDDGTLFCGLRSDNPSTGYIHRTTSSDSGATWAAPTRMWQGNGEPQCYQMADGRLLLGYRNSSGYTRFRSSHDRGASWTPESDFTSGNTTLMAYMQFVRLQSAASAVVWAVESAGSPSAQGEVYWARFDA